MKLPSTPTIEQDYAWFVAVPKRDVFTQPQFHFGERVKWLEADAQGGRSWKTGCIMGMKFIREQRWHYQIQIDADSLTADASSEAVDFDEADLRLVPDSTSVRAQLKPTAEWMTTQSAACVLGISPAQLRKLRRQHLFKIGYHYRDTSVPGSHLPRWQWHVMRCGKALEVPPEKRPVQTR